MKVTMEWQVKAGTAHLKWNVNGTPKKDSFQLETQNYWHSSFDKIWVKHTNEYHASYL